MHSVAVSIHKIIIVVPGFVLAMIIAATIAMAVSAIITFIIIFYMTLLHMQLEKKH